MPSMKKGKSIHPVALLAVAGTLLSSSAPATCIVDGSTVRPQPEGVWSEGVSLDTRTPFYASSDDVDPFESRDWTAAGSALEYFSSFKPRFYMIIR